MQSAVSLVIGDSGHKSSLEVCVGMYGLIYSLHHLQGVNRRCNLLKMATITLRTGHIQS